MNDPNTPRARNTTAAALTVAFFIFLPLILMVLRFFVPFEIASNRNDPISVAAHTEAENIVPPVDSGSAALADQAEADNNWQPLGFNAIGPNVNKDAGYVCEGERWMLAAVENDPNGNHLVWQGENDEYREFSYQWNGQTIYLTDVKTGQQLSFSMFQPKAGEWIVKGKHLEECDG